MEVSNDCSTQYCDHCNGGMRSLENIKKEEKEQFDSKPSECEGIPDSKPSLDDSNSKGTASQVITWHYFSRFCELSQLCIGTSI